MAGTVDKNPTGSVGRRDWGGYVFSLLKRKGPDWSLSTAGYAGPLGAADDNSVSLFPSLLCPARGLRDCKRNLYPLGMLSKCQAVMRFLTRSRGACEACAPRSKSLAGGGRHLPLQERHPALDSCREAQRRGLGFPWQRGIQISVRR